MTGTAGFVASHLAESLIKEGYYVVGLDSFSDYYSRRIKLSNISALRKMGNFRLVEADLSFADLSPWFRDVEYIFHLAAQPGVRGSWGESFSHYVKDNVVGTQRLLEAAARSKAKMLVYASSSSVYGEAARMPTPEETTPTPVSPYGATKLLGEHLCRAYAANRNLPVVVLRYFTLYGPRQRPDMAFNNFIKDVSMGKTITVYGDGRQKRDFTFVDDAVSATIVATEAEPGTTFNVGAGDTIELIKAIRTISNILGCEPRIRYAKEAPGDVHATSADIRRIKALGWAPKTKLRRGLELQANWQLHLE